MGTQPSGKLIWSVNLSPAQGGLESARQLQRGVVAMLQTMQQHQMPAAWTLPDPAEAGALCQEILRRPGQEVGLLGDSSWVGAGRTRFARELTRRTDAARGARIPITCLATGGARLEGELDILVRHCIASVRADGQQRSTSSRRFGIWQMPVTDTVPGRRGLFRGLLGYRRLLTNCVRLGQTVLLLADANRIAADDGARKLFQAVCRAAGSHQDLEFCRFSELGRQMLETRDGAPCRSILRAA